MTSYQNLFYAKRTLCFISRVIKIEKSSLDKSINRFSMLRWQMKVLTILKTLSGGNTAILRQNGAIAIFIPPPRKCECVPDCYEKLHFRPLWISMHIWLTSLIDCYTRNAFLFSGLVQILRHCANMVAPIKKSCWQKNCTGQRINLRGCKISLLLSCDVTWFLKKHDTTYET